MKKICFINYNMSVVGGIEQVTASLANALADFYEVHIISLCGEKKASFRLDERIKFSILLEKEERLRQMQSLAKPKLKAYFKENSIDIAIVQGNYPAFIAAPLGFSRKTALVFCDHGAIINEWEKKDITLIRFIASVCYKKIITLTEQNLSDYRKRFFTPKGKLCCITNWISDELPLKDSYNTESKKIVSAGRFGKEKGFDMLIKAFAPVAKAYPDWSLELFGDGEMMGEVKSLIEEYAIGENVKLLGMRSDLKERYCDYAMYVLPSYREGMPLVLLEAKANRLPIVSFDIMTGPREIVRDGVDGILVKPYDLKKMGEAITRLIEDTELRKAMSQKSQENIEKFSKSAILEKWRKLIDSL